jgi:uroporphyrinogen III methyltransferase/synthase
MAKSLSGKSIVVTRDETGNAEFAAKITQSGGKAIQFATIKIEPLTQTNAFLQTLAKFSQYDWIIFTSANGVNVFFDTLQTLNKDCRVFARAKLAAIGAKTAERLARFGIRADFVPNVFTGKDLAKQLINATNLNEKKVLLLRSDIASKDLPHLLAQANAQVDDMAIYTAAEVKGDAKQLKTDIAAGTLDWLTFASPSAVRSFFKQITPDLVNSSPVKVASIGPVTSGQLREGPVTSGQLRELAVKVDVQAKQHTLDGLLAAIEETGEEAKLTV